jgi:CheY-like chemotaxis protein
VEQAIEKHDARPRRILVAEDHRDSLEAMRLMFEAAGYDVITAENGLQAVAKAQSEGPDIILMDMMMPSMDGFTATRELRERKLGTPIIAVTAMEGARGRAIEAGVNDFVPKPIDFRELFRKVRRWLDDADAHPRVGEFLLHDDAGPASGDDATPHDEE